MSRDILSVAKRHAQSLKAIAVPEWTADPDEPFVIYAKGATGPVIQTCRLMAEDGKGNHDAVLYAALIIEKCALDKDGAALFEPKDHIELRASADAVLLQRIAGQILEPMATLPRLEALEKN